MTLNLNFRQTLTLIIFTSSTTLFFAQSNLIPSESNSAKIALEKYASRTQQRVEYGMTVVFDYTQHQYTGKTHLVYHNNSSETLTKAFFHLYPNAFQPGSAMDVRSLNIVDPDGRVGARISKLKPNEIGYLNVNDLTLNGKKCVVKTEGTILEVTLPTAIAPKSKVEFEFTFEGQVPIQIRRSGRNNDEGVDYSMAQWYPKICEFDEEGWHSDPYVAREFYGVWGDYDVSILIDQKFMVAATGILQNADKIGKGYSNEPLAMSHEPANDSILESSKLKAQSSKLNWHFKAQNVHDFVWAADPDYVHEKKKADDGTIMHFFYIPSEKTAAWKDLPELMSKTFEFAHIHYGKYPFTDYSFIQGGDGGMEYPMATLILGGRKLESLFGTAGHELMHSWYQSVLATNETEYPWMDEGFTSYASNYVTDNLRSLKLLKGEPRTDPMRKDVDAYCNYAKSGYEEALSTHADHYQTNTAYGRSSYGKGSVFLQEIKYIIGEENFNKGLLTYFDEWKFRHPNANDCVRVFEKQSGLNLQWFKQYFMNSTRSIDYAIDSVKTSQNSSEIFLKRVGLFIMPTDIRVTYKDGSKQDFYIPLDLMRGEKPIDANSINRKILKNWTWTYPSYTFKTDKEVLKAEIDPSGFLADVDRTNNVWEAK